MFIWAIDVTPRAHEGRGEVSGLMWEENAVNLKFGRRKSDYVSLTARKY
jgi:hypothetical protein